MKKEDYRKIQEAVQKLAGTYLRDIVSIMICKVTSVDKEKRTCDVSPLNADSDAEIPGVQLSAESNDGLLVLPKVDSTVIVALSTRNTAFVLMYSEIDQIAAVIGGTTFTMNDSLTKFNDGSFGGLIKIVQLVDKVNRLENKMNSHVHSGVQTGGGVTGTLTSPITPLTTRDDLENTKITHGE